MKQFPKTTKVIGECKNLSECAEWFKANRSDSIVTVIPDDIVDRRQYTEFLKNKFPSTRVDIFAAVELDELYEFYSFMDGIKKGVNVRDRPIPVRFPKFSTKRSTTK